MLLIPFSLRASDDSLVVRSPVQHGRLAVYLIELPESGQQHYLTLDAALRSGRVILHENNSQTLWIENCSDTDLFIQSGEIIKGGQQDRMLASDMIVAAHDTSRELHVYCVEQGRSTKRGVEPIETFSASPEIAPVPHLRQIAEHELTAKLLTPHLNGLTAPDPEQARLFSSLSALPEFHQVVDAAQEAIWKDVEIVQSGLTRSLRDSVTRNTSPTSLELTLEHPSLASERRQFEADLLQIVTDHPATCGSIYVFDGHIIGGDIYSSHSLFAALWPKLLRSLATQSLLVPTDAKSKPLPTTDDILNYLDASTHGNMAQQAVNERTMTEVTESQSCDRFATRDMKFQDTIHIALLPRSN
ncbi:MAG: hypothetical protein Q8922_01715 [Bacteroidota bacterium]|nr:hypothetical protein [Bacteroidota bacterium]MDP4232055.1 hypothetical protein [Bacteroidota bacterium]MDP4241238.1 hypothetical protein [Bacteroidota bacterium]MDP4286630.1 hypothetical protein [Bacteroidota bacterium]